MEFIIVSVIVIVAGYILYSNIKKQAKGDCGCGNGCKGCSHTCEIKPSAKNDDKIK
ncbi:FeoB-associated Cys-rich membrane protein [Clostridium tagluense]|uniref:FeoB-associated Cys-rich membrane protein n=1 Tax=Clostridium tagluense TaxID=360422 RepID=UPI001CF5BA13|nr:FeoB-associated Cys-rich membrane protein [Clostridium tagluense]MCB2298690.1 FeoB-associated Cys-rich membrane protein [Clostridium tagluense]